MKGANPESVKKTERFPGILNSRLRNSLAGISRIDCGMTIDLAEQILCREQQGSFALLRERTHSFVPEDCRRHLTLKP